jgi:hypothetical protein
MQALNVNYLYIYTNLAKLNFSQLGGCGVMVGVGGSDFWNFAQHYDPTGKF